MLIRPPPACPARLLARPPRPPGAGGRCSPACRLARRRPRSVMFRPSDVELDGQAPAGRADGRSAAVDDPKTTAVAVWIDESVHHPYESLTDEQPAPLRQPVWKRFDERWYLAHHPEVAGPIAAGLATTAEQYYLEIGCRLGHSPNMFFDENWYLSALSGRGGACRRRRRAIRLRALLHRRPWGPLAALAVRRGALPEQEPRHHARPAGPAATPQRLRPLPDDRRHREPLAQPVLRSAALSAERRRGRRRAEEPGRPVRALPGRRLPGRKQRAAVLVLRPVLVPADLSGSAGRDRPWAVELRAAPLPVQPEPDALPGGGVVLRAVLRQDLSGRARCRGHRRVPQHVRTLHAPRCRRTPPPARRRRPGRALPLAPGAGRDRARRLSRRLRALAGPARRRGRRPDPGPGRGGAGQAAVRAHGRGHPGAVRAHPARLLRVRRAVGQRHRRAAQPVRADHERAGLAARLPCRRHRADPGRFRLARRHPPHRTLRHRGPPDTLRPQRRLRRGLQHRAALCHRAGRALPEQRRDAGLQIGAARPRSAAVRSPHRRGRRQVHPHARPAAGSRIDRLARRLDRRLPARYRSQRAPRPTSCATSISARAPS